MPEFNRTFFERGMDFINLVHQTDADTDFDTDWIKITNYERIFFIIKKLGSEDVDTLGFQFVQATSDAGTAKGLNVSRTWYKTGTMTAQGVWTASLLTTPDDIIGIGATVTGGTVITSPAVTTGAVIIGVDVMASDLDIDGGYDWVAVRVEGDGVNNAALISIDAILMGGRFPQAVPLSAIA